MKNELVLVIIGIAFAALLLFASYHLEKSVKQQWMREVIQQELRKDACKCTPR